ncbi:DUF6766 family protein [Mycolicibacterium arabiense]
MVRQDTSSANRRRSLLHDNGLLLACLALFGAFFVGMILAGTATYNEEQREHGSTEQVSIIGYLTTGDFVEATFENWESEFLQMGMYVVLTAFLYQRGSSESKPIDGAAPQDEDPRKADVTDATPWPVRRGGLALSAYEVSLAVAFFVLFFASMALHALGGSRAFNDERLQHGQAAISCGGTSRRRSSGSSRCRTGRASSSPSPRSSRSRSSCVSAVRRSRSRSQRHTTRRAPDSRRSSARP